MLRRRWIYALLSLPLIVGLAACGSKEAAPEPAAEPAPAPVAEPAPAPARTATATLQGRDGTEVSGTVTFTETSDGVSYVAHVTGVEGEGDHGFHIHAVGDCTAADFTSAGGHFNPHDTVHGAPTDSERHVGDLGNISIAGGVGHLEGSSELMTFDGPNSILGKGVILHEGTDDLVSQPTGAAGARLACGVIEG